MLCLTYRSLREFRKFMTNQLDMRVEASNLYRFTNNFQSVWDVRFPFPVQDYVTEHVLVETFEEGVPVSQVCTCVVWMYRFST